MSVRNCLENILLVDFPQGCDVVEELKAVTQLVQGQVQRDVVADLSAIEILNTDHLAALLRLRQSLQACGHRLVLRNVGSRLRGVLSVTGLDAVFEIACEGIEANCREFNQRSDEPPVSAERPGL